MTKAFTNPIVFYDGRVVKVSSYFLKDQLKELGFLWDKDNRVWWMTPPPEKKALLSDLLGIKSPQQVIKPSPKRELLREYQRFGVDFLHRAKFALLGDKAGLGKTAQTLVYLDEADYTTVLIICPASVLYNWEAEIKMWTDVSDPVVVRKPSDFQSGTYNVVSYDIFRRNLKVFREYHIEALVCDESHYLKNPKAQRTMAVVRFVKTQEKLKSIVLLSGTPFLNSPIELFPQLNLLYPSEFPNFFKFGLQYADGKKNRWGWEFKGVSNPEELKTRMQSFFLGRTKKTVLKELPPVEFIHLPIESHLTEYNKEKKRIRKMMENGEDVLVIRANIFTLRKIVGILKVPSIIEVVENLLPEKVVVFGVHMEVVRQLSDHFGCPSITGSTPPERRHEIIKEYNQSGSILIISQAVQEGVNLQTSHHMVLGERLWNPAKEEQVYSRIHRIGQQYPVTVWIPILKNTLDERIHRMLISKGEAYARLFDIDKVPIKKLIDFI